eukprot:scaffold1789_cov375-Prasinococcus_capsulatus_cf.AAC.4
MVLTGLTNRRHAADARAPAPDAAPSARTEGWLSPDAQYNAHGGPTLRELVILRLAVPLTASRRSEAGGRRSSAASSRGSPFSRAAAGPGYDRIHKRARAARWAPHQSAGPTSD